MSKYSKLKKELLNSNHCPKVVEDNATISININDSSEIISPYAENNKPVISGEFASFLENSVKDIPANKSLKIEIISNNCDLQATSTAITNYYYNEFADSQRKLKHNFIASVLLFIVGIIALSATIILTALDTPLIISGTIDILAWVLLWEAFDLFFLRRVELRHSERRQMNFITAKISLIKPKSNTSKPSKKPLN